MNKEIKKLGGKLHDIMIGISLGDAHIRTKTKGKSWTLRFNQGQKNKEYCIHVYEQFKALCNNPPKITTDKDMRSGKLVEYQKITWQTRVTAELHYYGHLFYKWDAFKPRRVGSGIGTFVKVIPVNIEELISPISLAYLYMDDGHLQLDINNGTKGAYLCLGGFTQSEILLLVGVLNKKWGFDARIHEQKRIYIPQGSLTKFYSVIKPHIIDSMKYKIK
jgi:LAGLIDADG DNA endonuclease family